MAWKLSAHKREASLWADKYQKSSVRIARLSEWHKRNTHASGAPGRSSYRAEL